MKRPVAIDGASRTIIDKTADSFAVSLVKAVEVLAMVAKSEAAAWLERHGEPEKEIAEDQGEPKT